VNFGVNVEVQAPGIEMTAYLDIVNFDHYNMIIGTPFMHANKVLLDFNKNQVIANGIATPATRVVLDTNDGRLRRYRTVEKQQE
jgi:hypothetical protein